MSIAAVTFAAALVATPSGAKAEGKVPASFAVKTAIGPADAPVRTAVYNQSDRQQVKFQSAGWRGRAAYRAYYAPYYPSYGYYPAPVYSYYYPAPPVYSYVPRRAYYAPGPVYVPYGTSYYYGW
jgi:hypothetical protein